MIQIIDTGEELLNVYSVIASNSETITYTAFDASMAFITFFLSDDVQGLLQDFGIADYGETLFQPWILMLTSGQNPELFRWVENYTYFKGSECQPQYRYKADGLY